MANDSSQPREFDAVLGGKSTHPQFAIVLGGIQGLRQRFVTGNTEQRAEILAIALNYGEAGIDLLLEALSDTVLMVRATAYQILQSVKSDRVQQAIARGVALHKGDKIYRVYGASIDYDDESFYLINYVNDTSDEYCVGYSSVEPTLIGRYLLKETAEFVAEDLHQTILSGTGITNFLRRHNLKIDSAKMRDLENIYAAGEERLSLYNRNFEFRINDWCVVNWISIEDSDLEDDDTWLYQSKVLQYLQNSKQYDLLTQLMELLNIGKFAFVHEEAIDCDGYFESTVKI